MTAQLPSVMLTRADLAEAFRKAGLEAGMTLIMHSSLRAIGAWIPGGAEAVVLALMDVLTPQGTLMMPTHTPDNSDPQYWRNPPVPAEWWAGIRAHMPPYDPRHSRTERMGAIVEAFRTFEGVARSEHPLGSFAAWGAHAQALIHPHPLDDMFGEASPLARLYQMGGLVFLLGVGHGNNTALHYAEHRARFPKVRISESSAILRDGVRQWVTYTMLDYDDQDFTALGQAYESGHHPFIAGKVGAAVTRLLPARPLVDFATWWLSEHRKA